MFEQGRRGMVEMVRSLKKGGIIAIVSDLHAMGGEELMFFHLRNENGELSPFSSGTLIRKDGKLEKLQLEDFKIEVLDYWSSPVTGITYPSGWQVTIPGQELSMKIQPSIKNQELSFGSSSSRIYWEGRCKVLAEKSGNPIAGNAYVELVGY